MTHLVLFVSYSGVLGGGERILLDCATRLGRPALVACPEGAVTVAARDAGLRVAPVTERSLRLRGGGRVAARHAAGLAGLGREVADVARRERPAVVVAWSMRAVLACAALRAPVVAVHNDFVPSGPVGAAVRAASRRARAVVCLSDAIATGLRGELTVLRPGVDLAAWQLGPPPDGPPRALVLGALVPWKRPGFALAVAERVPELRVDLAGAPMPGDDPALVADLRRRAAALGPPAPPLDHADAGEARAPRARLVGHVDAREALAQAHVLLHAAVEPYGLALVEALAAGRPVVAPDAGGAREIVPATWRYRPGDADHAAQVLRATLADPDAPAAARRRAIAFDVRDSAARFAAVVEGVASR